MTLNNMVAMDPVLLKCLSPSGLDVHFVHVRPSGLQEGHSAKPLLMVHGWPGSFFEFYKILPLLTEGRDGLVFEVICPSIPGYGFSEAPHKTGGQ